MKGSEMEVHSEIEACRTCGIFFLTSSNLLRYLFSHEHEIELVRKELESWKMQLNENDAFPKYICTICLLEFHRIFKFQTAVYQTQQQLQQLYNLQQENIQKIKIKTEKCEEPRIQPNVVAANPFPEEPNVCAFVYVDDLSDTEENDNESKKTPFKVPHFPIKEEMIEEAYIPQTDESLAPEMSVLALTQATKEADKVQPNPEIDGHAVPCHLCLHVSKDLQQHRQHLLRIHETKPVECHVCGKQFPPGTTDTRLKYHMKWHRINKHIKCSQCGFHCPSKDVLNDHMRAVHTKTPCKLCGKLLLPRKMRLHIQTHEKAGITEKLDCPYCKSYFSSTDERNTHISLFHNPISDKITMASFHINPEAVPQNTTLSPLQSNVATPSINCETNSKIIDSSSLNETNTFLDAAEMSELNENIAENFNSYLAHENYTEDYSDGSEQAGDFVDNGNLYSTQDMPEQQEVVEENEQELEEMQFACAQCPESFTRVELLIAHAETHSEKLKPFECNICGKVFDLKFSLNRHLKRHKNTTL